MNRSTAVELINFRLGKGRVDLSNSVIAEMQLVQTILEHEPTVPWFLLEPPTTLVTVPTTGVDTFNLPDDFLRMPEEEEGGFYVLNPADGYWSKLTMFYSPVELQQKYRGEDRDLPRFFAIAGVKGLVKPVPLQDYTFQLSYYAADTALATDIENDWLKYAPDLIISRTTMNMANYLADGELFDKAKGDFGAAMARLVGENTARLEAGRLRMRGDPD